MKYCEKSLQKVPWGSQVTKISFKSCQGTAKGRPRGPKVAPRRPKGSPRWRQEGPKGGKMRPLGPKRCEKWPKIGAKGGKRVKTWISWKPWKTIIFIGFSWFLEGQRQQNSWKFVKFVKNLFGIRIFTENVQNFRRNPKNEAKKAARGRPRGGQGSSKVPRGRSA